MTKRITTIVIAAVTATALLAACGDDDKKSSSGDDSDTTAATGGENDAYCARLESFELATDSLDSTFANPTPESMRTAFETVESLLESVASNAPAEIEADVTALSDPLAQMIALFRSYDWDFDAASMDPEYATLGAQLDSAESDAAEARVNAWALATCGLDMAD